MAFTARQFIAAANRIRSLAGKGRKSRNRDSKRAGRSIRERYAQLYTENMHQTDDADRIVKVVELKIAAAAVDYLREQNVDTGEYEERITYNIESIHSGLLPVSDLR